MNSKNTKEEIIQQGAEAIIKKTNFLFPEKRFSEKKEDICTDYPIIQKFRIVKGYRIPQLDNKIRLKRTKSESKIIEKLANVIPVPKIYRVEPPSQIFMEYINGLKLSENLEDLDYKKICIEIAEVISKLHDTDIIHGDLTTSNMILKENEVYLIDFGLGFHSKKIEDKAVDLHLLSQALNAKHYKIADECIKIILDNYKARDFEQIIKRINVIESRGRYKDKY
jgi:Kae1-associated kinase Bud32